MLEVLSVGGPTPNRFDAARTWRHLSAPDRQPRRPSWRPTSSRFFAQDAWKLTPSFTLNYGLRWEGAFNPTPDANNEFLLNALRGVTFPIGRTVDPTQIPNQLKQFGPRVGFAWDPGATGKTVVRGYTRHLLRALADAAVLGPDEQLPRAAGQPDRARCRYQVPAGNPNDTLYEQLLLIGINLNTTR